MSLPVVSSCVRKSLALLLATAACVIADPAKAVAQPDLHSAPITRVAVDPANSILATASEDTTVRLWRLPAGTLLRTIKAPARPGHHGKILAIAISPDGRQLAFAGYTGQKNPRVFESRTYFDYEIYIHDLASGRLLRTLTVSGIVDDLGWSPDGKFLTATTSEFTVLTFDEVEVPSEALHIFRMPDYTRVTEARRNYVGAVAAFDRNHRLILIGKPGGHFVAEIFDMDFEEVESRDFRGSPAAARISPDGSMLAITTLFSQLSVHTTTDLSALYEHDFRGERNRIAEASDAEYFPVAWSADGRSLYVGGRGTCRTEVCAIRKWDVSDWRSYQDIDVSPHRITDLVPLRDGGVAFGTAGPGFGVVDSTGRRTLYRESPSATLTRQGRERARPSDTASDPRTDDRSRPGPSSSGLTETDRRQLDELHERVESLLRDRRYSDAAAVAREALRVVEPRVSPGDPSLIRPLWDLGRTEYVLGTYRSAAGGYGEARDTLKKAQDSLERALELLEAAKGAHHADVSPVAGELSDALGAMHDFDRALDLKQRALAILRTAGGADRLPVLKAANDLDILRVEKLIYPDYGKELSKALSIVLAQLRRAETSLGSKHVNVARGLSQLARIYGSTKVGVRGAALELHQRALAVYTELGLEDDAQALEVRMAVARLHVDAAQHAQAERIFKDVGARVEVALGSTDAALMQLWSERAFALRASGQHEAAAGLFTRVLSFWDERLRTESRSIHEVRRALERLGDTWRFTGQYSRAEPLYQRILDTRNQRVTMNVVNVARVWRKLGTSQRLRGDAASARKTYEGVLGLLAPHLSKPGGTGVADVISLQALQELAAIAVSSNDPAAARDDLRRAWPMDERTFWFFPGSDRDIVDESRERSRSRFYNQVLMVAARYPDQSWIRAAYDLVLDRKAIGIDLQLEQQNEHGPSSERTRRKLAELAAVRADLARLLVSGPGSGETAEYARTVTLLFEQAMTLEKDVSGTPRDPRRPRRRVTATDVAAVLPHHMALVEFVRVRDEDPASLDVDVPAEADANYVAFVVTPDGTVSLLHLGPAGAIDVLAGDIQSAMRSRANAALTGDLLKEMHRRVWAPIESLLGGVTQVVVSPDGELHRVPFAALIGQDTRFLIERFRFAYSGSGRDVVRPDRPRTAPALDLAVVADPDFGAGGTYLPLPGTALEAERIPPLVRGDRREVLRGGQATEEAFKRLPPARILHIATHGFFLERDTFGLEASGYDHALVKSGLVLAGANRSGRTSAGNDGLLTALELSGLDLSATNLVVLSSCDSGAGSVTHGQGVLGLRRALSLAGASNVLMTLWPVDDDITSEVMISFYQNLREASPATALHQAQLDVIGRIRSRDGAANPRAWAAFILEGASGFAPPASLRH